MHRTLKAETTRPPERDMASQQARFDRWRAEVNEERPHEALGGANPSSVYRPSVRRMPDVLLEPEYPGHFEVQGAPMVRFLSKDGNIRFKKHQFFVSKALAHEYLGLEEVGDGVWSLSFHDRVLARFDERNWKLRA
jgi:hypothetical protein